MKTLIFGCKGQLGVSLADTAPDTADIVGLDLPEFDITNAAAVLEVVRQSEPAAIVNAAAFTAVDRAESSAELVTAVNVEGAHNVAVAARDVGAKLVHISTDFVFDGAATEPYKADAGTNPLSVYGRTKRDSELAVLKETSGAAVVLRTAWLYSKTGSNFVKTMLRLMSDREELGVVADQFGTPTWSDSLAQAVWAFAEAPEHSGIFHWTDSGKTSWHGFASAIQEEALSLGLLDKAIPIRAIKSGDYPTAAARPAYSVLDCSKAHNAINMQPAPWRENLRKMLIRLKN